MYKRYISVIISILLIIVYMLYKLKVLTNIPCESNILHSLYSNFVHLDLFHIMSNLLALIVLSRLETKIGSKKFIILIILLLILNTLFDYIIRLIFKNIKCSIGFSGILFGILAFSLIKFSNNGKLDLKVIALIIILTIKPSLYAKNISLVGHSIGAISGIIIALFF